MSLYICHGVQNTTSVKLGLRCAVSSWRSDFQLLLQAFTVKGRDRKNAFVHTCRNYKAKTKLQVKSVLCWWKDELQAAELTTNCTFNRSPAVWMIL